MLSRLIHILQKESISQPLPRQGDLSDADYFRALCNIRDPNPVSQKFLELQDRYLQEETHRRGVVDVTTLAFQDRIALWQGDITCLNSDAIVNAGNSALLGCFQPLHSCIDNVIHSWAGVQVRLDCQEIMQGKMLPNGEVVVTKAYNLPSRYIFHTVGPMVRSRQPSIQDAADLKNCYLYCLEKALNMGLENIAFCCISTGLYGYPQDDAVTLAVNVVRDWLQRNDGLDVIFNVYLDEDRRLYEQELSR